MLTLEQRTSDWFVEKSFQGNGLKIPVLEFSDEAHRPVPLPLTPLLNKPVDAKIFFNSDPGIHSSIPRDEIQRGALTLSFTFKLPDHHPEGQSVFIHEARLLFVNRATDTILGRTEPKSGRAVVFNLTTDLDKESCEAYLNTLEGNPGGLHIISTIKFFVPALEKFKTLETIQPLSKIILWSGLNYEQLQRSVKLYAYDPFSNQFRVIPRIMRADPQRPRGEPLGTPQLMARNGVVGSNHAILQPVLNLHAASIVNSPVMVAATTAFQLDNLVLVVQEEHFPVVDNLQKRWYKDSKIPNVYWVRPSFEVVGPAQNADVDTAPFRFLFRQLGTGADGKPVLEGEIRVTLKYFIASQVKDEIEAADGNARLKIISPADHAIHLEIPFFTSDGHATTSTLPTQELTVGEDTITALFRLTNQWVRVCYGVLSAHNPAVDKQARVHIAYSFDGLEEEAATIHPLLLSQNILKIASVPIVKRASRSVPGGTYFDATRNTLHIGGGENMVFTKEGEAPRSKASFRFGKLATSAAVSATPAVQKITLLPVANNDKIAMLVAEKKFARRTYLIREQQLLNFDCTVFGTFYLERDAADVIQSIGCKEPYKLGEIDPQLFVHLPKIVSQYFKVYRSTQSPNRFLIQPTRYVVTRYEPEQEAYAFQTCMRLYSTIDAEALDRSRCMLDATLAPDIPRYALEELLVTLKDYTPYDPFISFPTEIEHKENYQWSIPGNIAENIESFSLGIFIRLVVAAKIEGALTLQAVLKAGGLAGKVDFELPDKSVLSSAITVSLQSVNGPFLNGPLIAKRDNNTLTVSNALRHVVQLMSCNIYGADAAKTTIVIEKSLQPEEEIEITIDSPGNPVIRYAVDKAIEDLEEIRQYLEDIECQIIFLSTINFEQEKIKNLTVTFGLPDQEQRNVQLSSNKNMIEEMLIMPLTDFLDKREVQYSVKVNKTEASQSYDLPLTTISLSDNGNIIHLNAQSIAPK